MQYHIFIFLIFFLPPIEPSPTPTPFSQNRRDYLRLFFHLPLIRFSFASNPFLNRSLLWEVNGTYNGLTTDLHGSYIERKIPNIRYEHSGLYLLH